MCTSHTNILATCLTNETHRFWFVFSSHMCLCLWEVFPAVSLGFGWPTQHTHVIQGVRVGCGLGHPQTRLGLVGRTQNCRSFWQYIQFQHGKHGGASTMWLCSSNLGWKQATLYEDSIADGWYHPCTALVSCSAWNDMHCI